MGKTYHNGFTPFYQANQTMTMNFSKNSRLPPDTYAGEHLLDVLKPIGKKTILNQMM